MTFILLPQTNGQYMGMDNKVHTAAPGHRYVHEGIHISYTACVTCCVWEQYCTCIVMCLSVCLSVCLFVPVCSSVCQSMYLSAILLHVYFATCCQSVFTQSACQSVIMTVSLSFHLSIILLSLSPFLSVGDSVTCLCGTSTAHRPLSCPSCSLLWLWT